MREKNLNVVVTNSRLLGARAKRIFFFKVRSTQAGCVQQQHGRRALTVAVCMCGVLAHFGWRVSLCACTIVGAARSATAYAVHIGKPYASRVRSLGSCNMPRPDRVKPNGELFRKFSRTFCWMEVSAEFRYILLFSLLLATITYVPFYPCDYSICCSLSLSLSCSLL